jgi:hypothetical protein
MSSADIVQYRMRWSKATQNLFEVFTIFRIHYRVFWRTCHLILQEGSVSEVYLKGLYENYYNILSRNAIVFVCRSKVPHHHDMKSNRGVEIKLHALFSALYWNERLFSCFGCCVVWKGDLGGSVSPRTGPCKNRIAVVQYVVVDLLTELSYHRKNTWVRMYMLYKNSSL